jgi:hypothetical protein
MTADPNSAAGRRQQPFERYLALASWIERLGHTTGLSLGEWMSFLGALNAALGSVEARADRLMREMENQRARAESYKRALAEREALINDMKRDVR